VTMKAVCLHFNVSDNRESMFDAESSCLPDYAVLHVDVSAIKESMCNEKTIRVNIHVSDDRETMSDAENKRLPVDAVLRDDVNDDRKWLYDEISYLRACSRER
jgi:hypothetical protein